METAAAGQIVANCVLAWDFIGAGAWSTATARPALSNPTAVVVSSH